MIHRVIAALMGVVMLAAPALAARQTACGGDCFQLARPQPAAVSPAVTNCCDDTQREGRSTSGESGQASTCLACCGGDLALPPVVPASREPSVDVASLSTYLVIAFAVPNDGFRHALSAPISAPFWFADDGPSRQAFLGRFAF